MIYANYLCNNCAFGAKFLKISPDSVNLVKSAALWVRVGSCNNLKLKTKRGGTLPRTKRLHNVSRLEAGMQNTKHT